MGLFKMSVENLFSIGQRSVESSLDNVDILNVLLVVDKVVLLPDVLENLRVACDLRVCSSSKSSA